MELSILSSDRSRNCIRRWIQLCCLSVPYCQVWQRRCESIENTFDIAVSGEFRSSLSSNLLCHYAAAVIAFFTVPTEFVRWLLNLIVQYEGMLLAEFLQLVWRDERVIRVDDLVIGFVPPGCGLSGGPGSNSPVTTVRPSSVWCVFVPAQRYSLFLRMMSPDWESSLKTSSIFGSSNLLSSFL